MLTAALTITAAMSLVSGMAVDMGVDPALACRIVEAESRWDQFALGDYHMPSPSAGPWQFQEETWEYGRQSMGLSDASVLRYNWAESTKTALWLIANGRGSWWSTWEEAQDG